MSEVSLALLVPELCRDGVHGCSSALHPPLEDLWACGRRCVWVCSALCNFALDKTFLGTVTCGAGQEEISVDAFPHMLLPCLLFLIRLWRALSTAQSAQEEQVHPMFWYVPWREPCRAACTVGCLQEQCWAGTTEKFWSAVVPSELCCPESHSSFQVKTLGTLNPLLGSDWSSGTAPAAAVVVLKCHWFL